VRDFNLLERADFWDSKAEAWVSARVHINGSTIHMRDHFTLARGDRVTINEVVHVVVSVEPSSALAALTRFTVEVLR